MHIPRLVPFLLAAATSPVLACNHSPSSTASSTSGTSTEYPRIDFAPDVRPALETTGYFLNHFSLVVSNLTASLDFYTRVLGMRRIFTYEATPWFSITYIGTSHGGKNGTGWQTTAEINRQKNNIEGLLELIERKNPPSGKFPPGSAVFSSSFSHIGLVVPDALAAQKRLEENGVTILKRVGQSDAEVDEAGQRAMMTAYGMEGATEEEQQMLLAALVPAGGRSFCMILDPDGNFIEVQPQWYPEIELS